MLRLSTGLRNSIAATYGILPQMQGGVIRIYGGTPPVTPDNGAFLYVLLGVVTTAGLEFIPDTDPYNAGLQLVYGSPGILMNKGNWVLSGKANGTATWFRWYRKYYDSDEDSNVQVRMDGSVGDVLVLQQPIIEIGRNFTIDSFLLQVPMG